jgi:pimeloyl-ACP methyl ester carboxylesterase
MKSRTVDVNGLRMRWEEEGEGHSIVFIHVIPASLRMWWHVVPGIQKPARWPGRWSVTALR